MFGRHYIQQTMAMRPLDDRRFWYGYLRSAFGQRTFALDDEVMNRAFGAIEAEALDWWRAFSGWYEGIFDTTDGIVQDPGLLIVPLSGGRYLVLEVHAGDSYLRHVFPSGRSELLANIGPHFIHSERSFGGLLELAGDNPHALLLLSPIATLPPTADPEACADHIARAWTTCGVLDALAATDLAYDWLRVITELPGAAEREDGD
ncbi:MAG: hypothetical protein KC731_25175 [Myxococcales bacterium]|nr:hypothetical protein [Myxococcales bacterium]